VHPVEIADLYDTGLSADFSELSPGSDDPHYAVLEGPFGSGQDVVGCVSPIWVDCVSSDPDSQWLTLPSLPGDLTIRTSFTIPPDAELSSVVLRGRFVSQNGARDIQVNGVSIYGGGPGGFTQFDLPPDPWRTLDVRAADHPGAFAHGVNTLDFVVDNGSLVAGLRTDDLHVEALPEPRSLAALAAGLAVVALLRRRRGAPRA
jgi:hypothetical protein